RHAHRLGLGRPQGRGELVVAVGHPETVARDVDSSRAVRRNETMANVTRALAAGAIASLCAAAACEVAFPVHELDADGGAVDASADADAQQRGASVPDGCDPTATFGAPSLLVFANFPYAVYSPHLSPDERNVYFQSVRDQTTNDLFVARRGGASGPFDTP